MAVVEDRVRTLSQEATHTRRRLHDIESDRATIRLLAARIRELANDCEKLADRAAEAAVRKILQERENDDRERSSLRANWVSVTIAGAALLLGVVSILIAGGRP